MTVLKQFSQWLDDNNPIADTLLLQYYVENDSLGNMTYEKIRDYDIVETTFYINNYNQSGLLSKQVQLAWEEFKDTLT